MRCSPLVLFCIWLIAAICPSAPADPPHPSGLRPDILYTTKGEFVQVSPMRALTLNAHVKQFQYDPLGLELAYVGSETNGETTTHFVKTIDAGTGKQINSLTMTDAGSDQTTGVLLTGWSSNGRCLMLTRLFVKDADGSVADSPETGDECLRWDVSTIPPTLKLVVPDTPLPDGANLLFLTSSPSPKLRWIAFQQGYQESVSEGQKTQSRYRLFLYNVDTGTMELLPLKPDLRLKGWIDETHLSFMERTVTTTEDERQYQSYNVESHTFNTGSSDPDPPLFMSGVTSPGDANPRYPDLTLDTEFREQDDSQNTGGFLDSSILWVRRTPLGKIPLGAAAAGILPRQHRDLGEFNNDEPQAVWSPTGQQIAFIANDDLYVTDLRVPTDLLSHEKLAVGLKLSCDEERELAVSNLKQIGLGIIQYSQDNDEKFPVAEGFVDTIYPYIKSKDVFSVDGHKFVYLQPKELSLAKMEDPAETDLGYIDLPCARVVLFADGDVKVQPKAGNEGGNGE